MKKRQTISRYVFFAIVSFAFAAPYGVAAGPKLPPRSFDESKVPEYVLPDPLKMEDGRKVDSAERWMRERRPELLKMFAEQMHGKVPDDLPISFRIDRRTSDPNALNGKATRTELRLRFFNGQPKEDDPGVNILIYVPNAVAGKVAENTAGTAVGTAAGKVPAFLGYNFNGNHTICDDPGITLGTVWPKRIPGPATPGTDKERGTMSRRWPLDRILDNGFAVITANYTDIDPDFDDGFQNGVHALIYRDGEKPKPDQWGSIATWAWGLSRILDAVEQCESDPQTSLRIDPKKVVVLGHSRLGKTSLWAGAQDQRFIAVVSNNSGSCGAALSRRWFGETVRHTTGINPNWFSVRFRDYDSRETSLKCPFDQHELIALIAPRPVYVSSASEDFSADPRGEFLALLGADPVYRLFGLPGLDGCTEMPPPDKQVGKTLRYHVREGKHDILEYDWIRFIDFAKDALR